MMKKKELRWWIAGLGLIFLVVAARHILGQEGGIRYFFYTLDWIEVAGTLLVTALGTLGAVWQGSVLVGLLFVLVMLIVLLRAGRLGKIAPSLALFACVLAIPCVLLWHYTRQHLPMLGAHALSFFWITSPVLIYLAIRHVILRRNESWTVRDRRIAYGAASLTFLLGSLSVGTLKSDAEVVRSLQRGRDIVYKIKQYHATHQRLPESLEELVPGVFPAVPETDVPEGWGGRERYVYQREGRSRFTLSFESAGSGTCNYRRSKDSWRCL
jgi:hypothetical protein